jgi:hypothetical protein
MLFALMRRLGFETIPSGCACLFFALAPYRVESVAWIAARKDVLALFLALISWHLHLSVGGSTARKTWFLALAAVAMVASFLSKSAAVVVPFMILISDVSIRKIPVKSAIFRQSVYVAPVVGVILLLPLLWSQAELIREPIVPGFVGRLSLVGWTLNHYLSTALWPFQLSPLYAEPSPDSLAIGTVGSIGALVAIVGMLVIVSKYKLNTACAWTAFLWFVIGIGPFLNLIPMYYVVADRYLLFASFAIALVAAMTARWALGLKSLRLRLMVAAGLASIAVSWGIAAHGECRAWSNNESLWLHAVERQPHSFFARIKCGKTLLENGEYKEASIQYRQAQQIRPLSPSALVGVFTAELRLDIEGGRLSEDDFEKYENHLIAIANDGSKLKAFAAHLRTKGYLRAASVVMSRMKQPSAKKPVSIKQ